MRSLVFTVLVAFAVSSNIGCIIPAYSGDPNRRARQLVITSENLRMALEEWERFWLLDQPSHLSPQRTHGGIL
jgi:hypothetical protein